MSIPNIQNTHTVYQNLIKFKQFLKQKRTIHQFPLHLQVLPFLNHKNMHILQSLPVFVDS